jgi:hypothetical protein
MLLKEDSIKHLGIHIDSHLEITYTVYFEKEVLEYFAITSHSQ